MKYLATPLIAIFLFSSCTTKTEYTPNHSQSIDRLYQQFSTAYQTKDIELVSGLYAENATYLPGSSSQPILEGKKTIRDTFERYFRSAADGNRDLDISFNIIRRQIADSLAYDSGYYLIQSRSAEVSEFPEGGTVGKFVTVIGLQDDGSWRFLVDGFSPAPFAAFSADSTAYNPSP